jgi:hypothetical protein
VSNAEGLQSHPAGHAGGVVAVVCPETFARASPFSYSLSFFYFLRFFSSTRLLRLTFPAACGGGGSNRLRRSFFSLLFCFSLSRLFFLLLSAGFAGGGSLHE